MERIGEVQKRLQLASPFLLFHGIPANVGVNAKIHGWINSAAQAYALDYGTRPPAFTVPAGGVPPVSGVLTRMPQAIVALGAGGPVAPGPREDEYAYQYVWTAFAPVMQGAVVPHGKQERNFVMPAANLGTAPDDATVLRFRWRGTALAAQLVGTGDGTVGLFVLDLTVGGTVALPIMPGTVEITAPLVAGGNAVARDWPWPTSVERSRCTTGRLIGDVEPTVDSVIDYTTGVATITFNGNIVAAPNNILADFEHDGTMLPIDIRIAYDINAI